jgi:hypothetical protein
MDQQYARKLQASPLRRGMLSGGLGGFHPAITEKVKPLPAYQGSHKFSARSAEVGLFAEIRT